MEIRLIIKEIHSVIQNDRDLTQKNLSILEFGSGRGYQIPYLRLLGNLVSSDIYTSKEVKGMPANKFVECDITQSPFEDESFDVIFSNHVLEHIRNIEDAFQEIQRIGKSSCIYAFSVPTNIWLLLSIPAQYHSKMRKIAKSLSFKSFNGNEKISTDINGDIYSSKKEYVEKDTKRKSITRKLIRFALPGGHGTISNFFECYSYFKIKSWERLFHDNGFSVIKIKPLLLYGPSEWPVISTSKNRGSCCSSVLFLLHSK